MTSVLTKFMRYTALYGWRRTVTKVLGRLRPGWLPVPPPGANSSTISVIGCGQFAFSTLCFFLRKHQGNQFLDAFDTDNPQAETLARQYGFRRVVASVSELLDNPDLKLLYIASNHASHTPYAIQGLNRNLDVYVEKPVAVTRTQLVGLVAALHQSTGRLYAGYNRPYAPAIRLLRQRVVNSTPGGPFSISYHINGHQIRPDHWYRRPDEGTRIAGNLGHWIDLTIHIWAWRGLPDWIDIQLAYANPAEPDDNLTVTLTTDRHDLVTMLFTSRSEPFEGVSESINVHVDDIIARIDDFRHMTIWQGARKQSWRFSPKDVGHERAVLQPFKDDNRSWHEVELSTLLMLFIRDAILDSQTATRFAILQELAGLAADVHRFVVTPSFPVHE